MTMAESTINREWLPKPEDELLHEPYGNDAFPWKETFFLSMHDAAKGLTLNMHQTVSANRTPNTRQAIGIAQGARNVSVVRREDGVHDDKQIGNGLSRLEIVNLSWDSDHELRWVGDAGEASFDLTLKGRHWGNLWDTMFKGFFADGSGDGQFYCHAEQLLTVTGTVTWKGEEPQQFDGFGWRDRGWGRRKTQLMWNSGWDLMAGVLPDGSVFSTMALRHHELPDSAPLPAAGWYADATTLTPCTGGFMHKEATTVPRAFELHFDNGHSISGELVRPTGRVAVAMQESEVGPDSPNWAMGMQDTYSLFRDPDGNEFGLYSQIGFTHRVDAFRDAQFIHAGNPLVTA